MLCTLVPVQLPDPADGILMVMCADCVDKVISAFAFVQTVIRANSWWTAKQPECDSIDKITPETVTLDTAEKDEFYSNEEYLLDEDDYQDGSEYDGHEDDGTGSESDTTSLPQSVGLKHVKYFPKLDGGADRSFRCCGRKCWLTFTTREELEKHGTAVHGVHQRALDWDDSFQYECTVCLTRFSHRKNLLSHLRRLVRDYQCPVCRVCFDRPRLKMAHMKQLHPDYLRFAARKSYSLEAQPLKICCGCGERFNTIDELTTHGKQKHAPAHGQEQEGLRMDSNWQCTICYKRFKTRANLQNHQRSVYLEKPFTCGQCGEAFTYLSRLEAHEQGHALERRFVCETCGNAFKTKVGLTAHGVIHREKTFQCTECDYSSSKSFHLTSHMRRHSDNKPFQCQQCPMQFRTKSNLVSHMQSHGRVKSFPCRYCDRQYKYVSDRTKHEREHTGLFPYGCGDCGKKFVRPGSLKAHVQVCKMRSE
ncbi:hypothetical protein ZHAS_00020674 [Anopheles sinensis]|uniref:C2H2-type domain-containing protein n=1 Tax=Anopheles sinensis TaxID=74873 RepID=A0A084WQD5_ANOSI|nr:hypothetical protein ZHAS_00020674 [Anopheles sinensis]